jgi:hypothetical protein
LQELGLSFFAYFGEKKMTAIAYQLLRGILKILYPFVTSVLPRPKASGHRSDVLIAHFFEGLAGNQ